MTEATADRLALILAYIDQYQQEKRYSPSLRELCKVINVDSTSLVCYYLDQLTDEGLITRAPRIARAIVITPAGREAIREMRQ